MNLTVEKTCAGCGYQRTFCQCGRPKNTSGETKMFQTYDDWTSKDNDYSRTASFNRAPAERKYMEELYPINKEPVDTWIQRTSIASKKCCEHSYAQHLFNTRKQWACHTSSRYCFICVMIQQIEMLRILAISLTEMLSLHDYCWYVTEKDGGNTFSIAKSS